MENTETKNLTEDISKLILPNFQFGHDYNQLMRSLMVFCDKHIFMDIHVIQKIIEKSKPTEETQEYLNTVGYKGDFSSLSNDEHFYGDSLLLITMELDFDMFSKFMEKNYNDKLNDENYINLNFVEISKKYTEYFCKRIEEIIDIDEIEDQFSDFYIKEKEKLDLIKESSLQNVLPFLLAPESENKFMWIPQSIAFSGSIPSLNPLVEDSIIGLYNTSIHDINLKMYDSILIHGGEGQEKIIVMATGFTPKIHFKAMASTRRHTEENPVGQDEMFFIINQFTAIFKSLIDPSVIFFRTPLTHLEEILYGFIDFNGLDQEEFNLQEDISS